MQDIGGSMGGGLVSVVAMETLFASTTAVFYLPLVVGHTHAKPALKNH